MDFECILGTYFLSTQTANKIYTVIDPLLQKKKTKKTKLAYAKEVPISSLF